MNVFDLMAKIGLDSSDYEKGLDESESKFNGFGNKIANGVGTIAKVTAGAVAAGTVAVGKLVSDSVSAYSEYEQNLGGVRKLYGNMGQSLEEYAKSTGRSVDEVRNEWQNLENAQNLVLENAKNAYKTAGMDANTYMTTATSFSASLINSLDGDTMKAAEQTDVAMRAISDNWNTFGGDIQNIQNAYQGFAKQNYTMLDNLKLGYGGTKTEMERLIADANEYAKSIGLAGDLSIDSFSDVVSAIDLVQQKQGIAGTTQREAATTIQGSLTMVKAAWQNLVIGLTDSEADINQLMDNLITAIVGEKEGEGLINNIVPAIERALSGVVTLFERLAPIISDELPGLVEQILPPLIEAAATLIAGLITALPALIQVLIEQIPVIAITLWNAIIETLPMFIEAGQNLIQSMTGGVDMTIPEIIAKIGEMLVNLLNQLFDALPGFLERGGEFITNMIQGIQENLPGIIETVYGVITDLITTIMDRLPEFLEKGVEVIGNIITGIGQALPDIISSLAGVTADMLTEIGEHLPEFLQKGIELIGHILSGIIEAIPDLIAAIPNIIEDIKEEFTKVDWLEIGKNILLGIRDGFVNAGGELISGVTGTIGDAWNAITSWLGIASPSKKAKDEIGANWAKGIGEGFKESNPVNDMLANVQNAFDDIMKIFNNFDWNSLGTNIIDGISNGIAGAAWRLADTAMSAVRNAWNSMTSWLGIASPSKKAERELGRFWAQGIGIGFEENLPIDNMVGAVEDAFDEIGSVQPSFDASGTRRVQGTFAPVLNIYGADGQNVNDLADIIMERLTFLYNQEGSAYGVA